MEEFIQTLPKQSTSMMNGMPLYCYEGFWYPAKFIEEIIKAQRNFKAEPTEILLGSYPKTGTTWLKALTFAIATRKIVDESNNPLLTSVPHDCIPWLETDQGQIQINRKLSGPPLIASHFPYSSLPESIIASDCKIVYIHRDPKDMITSAWHFLPKLTKSSEDEGSLEKLCDEFCQGLAWYGPYWDHISGYMEATLARPGRILILTYEDLKKNTFGNVKRLAEFMGYPFSEAEEKEGVVERIIKLCSFENLTSLEVNKSGQMKNWLKNMPVENRNFFRKGEVGDWKNHFTNEIKEKIDQVMEEKLSRFRIVQN